MTTVRSSRSAAQRFACALGASALVLSFSGALSGCGPEAQTPVKAPDPATTAPGGGSADDYGKKMQEMQQKGGK